MEFTRDKTNYCKGIAIIFMVIHHLFYDTPNIGIMVGDVSLTQRLGIVGKVCVSIFLLLSGLGIYKSWNEKLGIKEFYKKYLSKVYLNYLFIVIISIVVGLIFFRSELLALTGNGLKGIYRIFITFTGMQYIIGYKGLIGAWWFTTLILIFYLSFPFFKSCIAKYNGKFLAIALGMAFLDLIPEGNLKIFVILSWVFPFVFGIYLAHNNVLEKVFKEMNKGNIFFKKLILFSILVISLIIRQSMPANASLAIKFDYLLAFIIVISVHNFFNSLRISKPVFIYLGEKSMNIYYLHMFITHYYLGNFTYSLKNPIYMVLFVIIVSILWGYICELLKKIIRYDKINEKIGLNF